MLSQCFHWVRSVKISPCIEREIESTGRKFFVHYINVETDKGNAEICLFSDEPVKVVKRRTKERIL